MAHSPIPRQVTLSLVALALVGGLFVAPAGGAAGAVLVGFAPGSALPAGVAAAGEVVAVDSTLGIAVLHAGDAPAALALLQRLPGVDFAEMDGAVQSASATATSARWDSARWDSARWDSSRWDSSRWDSSRWDGTSWDSSRWDSARWDSARWDSTSWDGAQWNSARWDGSPFVADPLLSYQWGLAHLEVPEAWTRTTGGMAHTLCVVDTGVDFTHPDLAPNAWTGADGAHGWSFLDGTADVSDDAGHGTHVAGVAAAAVGNGIGTAGVADARIMAAKVLNAHGVGGLGNLAQGIRWCADHGAHVISMSLSTTQDSQAVRRAVEHAAARGALLVASAGTAEGCDGCETYPAAYPQVLGVAALDRQGAPAAFSRAGAHVDLAAPGELIAGPFPGEGYALGSGTSQATALVAGAALLAWDADPTLSAAQVEALLRASARDLGAPGWDPQTGWGEPDVAALVGAAIDG